MSDFWGWVFMFGEDCKKDCPGGCSGDIDKECLYRNATAIDNFMKAHPEYAPCFK